jgi:hypothetical protein
VGTPTPSPGQKVGEGLPVVRGAGVRLGFGRRRAESLAAAREEPGAGAVGQKAVVTDPDEALGKDVEEEAATELTEGECLGPGAARAIVLVAEGDDLGAHVDQPVVGDRDAVGVAGQVLQDFLGAVEGWLDIDNPLGAPCFVEAAVKGSRMPVGNKAAVERQPSLVEGSGEGS